MLVVQSKAPPGKPLNRRGHHPRLHHVDGGRRRRAAEGNQSLITLLRDTNRDGQVDERSNLLTGLTSLRRAWADDTLYVAAADAVLAYPYQLGQAKIDAAPRVLTPLTGGPSITTGLGPGVESDGRFLYASVGLQLQCRRARARSREGSCRHWQIDRQTGADASLPRPPQSNGLNFHPETGETWTVVNERDELGPNLVPDYMTSVRDGGFYGWPWSYYGQNVDIRVRPPRPDGRDCIKPDYALTSTSQRLASPSPTTRPCGDLPEWRIRG